MRLTKAFAVAVPAAACAAVAGAVPGLARADVAGFFQGKTVTIIVGQSPGGLYDTTSRLVGRHIGRHLPGNPTFVVQNMPGAGSTTATNHLYVRAPKDGTVLGVVARGQTVEPLLNPKSIHDSRRFNWLGSLTDEVSVGVVWHTSPVHKFDDLYVHETVVGGTGPGADTDRIPKLLIRMTGAKLKLISGYPGGNEITAAMEKGEVQGRFGWSWGSVKSRSRAWLDEKKIRVVVQAALERAPDLPDVPSILDFAKTDEDKQVIELLFSAQSYAWPMMAPPEVPADRVAALRKAYADAVKDKALLGDAEKLNIEVNFMPGEEINRRIERLYTFSPEVRQKALDYITR